MKNQSICLLLNIYVVFLVTINYFFSDLNPSILYIHGVAELTGQITRKCYGAENEKRFWKTRNSDEIQTRILLTQQLQSVLKCATTNINIGLTVSSKLLTHPFEDFSVSQATAAATECVVLSSSSESIGVS